LLQEIDYNSENGKEFADLLNDIGLTLSEGMSPFFQDLECFIESIWFFGSFGIYFLLFYYIL